MGNELFRLWLINSWAGHDSSGTPVKNGPDLTYNGYFDAFIAIVDENGFDLDLCGYIGGDDNDEGYGIAVDKLKNMPLLTFVLVSSSIFSLPDSA
jgi:hypothetical protein